MSIMLGAIQRLTKDLKEATATLSKTEARYLVDYYYQIQEFRKSAGNQEGALEKAKEPHEVLNWFYGNAESLERNIKSALGAYSQSSEVGRWAESITGIGPVISAGLLAYLDIEKAPTVGHIWRFAGYDSTQVWLGAVKAKELVNELKEETRMERPALMAFHAISQIINCQPSFIKEAAERYAALDKAKTVRWSDLEKAAALRPWNHKLKVLCWKIGESFVKVSTNDKDIYGKVYVARKEYESAKNEKLEYKDQAEDKLKKFKIGKTTDAYGYYSQGKLPPGHLHERAKRYAVKLFLAHWHHVAYETHYQKLPPKPYVIEHLGHADYIKPPNWPMA